MSAILLMGYSTAGNGHVQQSTDGGKTWALRSDIEAITPLYYGGLAPVSLMVSDPTGQYVLLLLGTGDGQYLYSGDYGKTFAASTLNAGNAPVPGGVLLKYLNGQFLLYNGHDHSFYVSPTGAPGTWVQKGTVSQYSSFYDVGYVNGTYFFVNNSTVYVDPYESTDLVNWTQVTVNGGNGIYNALVTSTFYSFTLSDGSLSVCFPNSNNAGTGQFRAAYTRDALNFVLTPAANTGTTGGQNNIILPAGNDSRIIEPTAGGVLWFDVPTLGYGKQLFGDGSESPIAASYRNGLYYALTQRSADYTYGVWSSPDGLTWTQQFVQAPDPNGNTFNPYALIALPGAVPVQPFWTAFQGATEND